MAVLTILGFMLQNKVLSEDLQKMKEAETHTQKVGYIDHIYFSCNTRKYIHDKISAYSPLFKIYP